MATYICKYYDKDRIETGNTLEISGNETLTRVRDRIRKNANRDDVYYNIFTPSNNRISSRELKI